MFLNSLKIQILIQNYSIGNNLYINYWEPFKVVLKWPESHRRVNNVQYYFHDFSFIINDDSSSILQLQIIVSACVHSSYLPLDFPKWNDLNDYVCVNTQAIHSAKQHHPLENRMLYYENVFLNKFCIIK